MDSKYQLADDQRLIQNLFDRHAVSTSLSMLGVQACLIINSILAGNFFAATGLAVMSVVAPLYSIFAAVGALVGIGGAILTAYSLGRDDKVAANEDFTCSLVTCIGLSAVVSVVVLIFENELLKLFGCTEELYQLTSEYSTVYIAGGLGTALFYLPYHFLKLVGKLKVLIFLFAAMAVENFLLDVFFCSILQMGIAGIAWGTVLSSILTGIVGILILLRGEESFSLVRGKFRFSELVKFGTPSALNNISNFARFIIMNHLLLAVIGNFGLVIFSVIKSIEYFANIILSGLAQGSTAFVSVLFQEHDNTSLRRIEKRAHVIGFAFIGVMILGMQIFSAEICKSFGIVNAAEVAELTRVIDIFAVSLIPSVACMLLASYYQAAGFTKIASAVITCRGFILLLIPAYLLPKFFGADSIWYSFVMASVGALFVLAAMVFANRAENRSSVLLLDLTAEKFGEFISFSVKNELNDIVESVHKIENFCTKNILNRTTTLLIKLSIEEIMILIKDNCVTESIDVRILILREDKIILRVRYGGKLFNPVAYYESKQETDPLALGDALGIAMILNAAVSVNYKHTFGVNNLTVILNYEQEAN